MKFAEPRIVALLLALLPLLCLGWWYLRRRVGSGSMLSMLIVKRGLPLRALCALMLLLALARPYSETVTQTSNALLLLDVSYSMEESAARELGERAASFADSGLKLEMLPFAGKSAAFSLPFAGGIELERLRSSWAALNTSETNLQQAFEALSAYQNASVLLASDGWSTRGNYASALAMLQAAGTKIYPLVPAHGSTSAGQFEIASLYAPLVAPAQRSVEIRAGVRNTTASRMSGNIEIVHGDKVVLKRAVTLEPGAEQVITTQSDPSEEGIKRVTATLRPDDSARAASTRIVYVSGETREKILLISGASEDGRLLQSGLSRESYQVTALDASAGLSKLGELSDYSSVIFNNVAMRQLPPGSSEAVAKYVESGGGFMMIGGNRSFGLGGYIDTAIERILPVKLVPPQTVKKRLNIAVELVLDKSRSMADANKLDFAKEAAREVIRNLKDEDYIGVIGFDSAPFEVVKLAPVSSMRDHAEERVGRLFPTGKTNLMPAMDEARRRLDGVNAGRKHMIILTDGQLPDGGPYYVEMVRQMRFSGITVSTVLLGPETDLGLLRSMGNAGGGAFYQTDDPRSLPRIFLSDIKVSSGEQTLKEASEYLVRPGPDGVLSTSISSFPPLRGYVETERRERAQLELLALAAERAQPLLASWKYGQGRVIAFTSDANGRWSSYWASWPRFLAFWGDLIDKLRGDREKEGENVRFDLKTHLEKGALMLDLSLFSEDAARAVSAEIKLPDDSRKTLSFTRTARGRYRAELETPMAGGYELYAQAGSAKLTPVGFHLSAEEFGEKRGRGYNLGELQMLASSTGGVINPAPSQLSGAVYRTSKQKELAPLFFLIAMLILLGEILWREIYGYRSSFLKKHGVGLS